MPRHRLILLCSLYNKVWNCFMSLSLPMAWFDILFDSFHISLNQRLFMWNFTTFYTWKCDVWSHDTKTKLIINVELVSKNKERDLQSKSHFSLNQKRLLCEVESKSRINGYNESLAIEQKLWISIINMNLYNFKMLVFTLYLSNIHWVHTSIVNDVHLHTKY